MGLPEAVCLDGQVPFQSHSGLPTMVRLHYSSSLLYTRSSGRSSILSAANAAFSSVFDNGAYVMICDHDDTPLLTRIS